MRQMIVPLTISLGLMACSQGPQFSVGGASDNFGQSVLYNNKVDVVFVVENTSPMGTYIPALNASIPGLVNALLAQKLDLHVGIISSSMGGANPNGGHFLGNPRILTSATPNLANEMANRISSVGSSGSDLARGLDSLSVVLSPAYQNGEGAGFLRSTALLAIITISLQDDHSSLISGGASAYGSYLNQLKGFNDDGSRKWLMNYIGVLSLSGACFTTPALSYKEPGVAWMNLSTLTSGITAAICTQDWSVTASNVKARIAQILTDYHLSKVPDVSTIKVSINGVSIPRSSTNGWDYISATNVVRFYGSAIPTADGAISVTFTPASPN